MTMRCIARRIRKQNKTCLSPYENLINFDNFTITCYPEFRMCFTIPTIRLQYIVASSYTNHYQTNKPSEPFDAASPARNQLPTNQN
jgi:hypothetical protein